MTVAIRRCVLPLLLVILCAALLLSPAPVHATAYTVTCSDSDLISKINSAAGSSNQADTVTLTEDCVYTLTSAVSDGTDNGANGLRRLTSASGALTIIGNGATIQRSSANGTASFRLFEVSSGTLIIENLMLANGSTSDAAGLWNYGGTVTLRNATITGSRASSDGGGIANSGTMTLINSTISGNSAGNNAGGIYNDGTLTLTNSTVSGNSATVDGGGIYNIGTLSLVQATLTANSAGRYGGGLYMGGTTSLHNSLIGDSTSGSDCSKTGSPAISALGANLVEDGGCGLSGSGYLNADPRLGALASNGGTTQTHALLTGSPALNAGSNPPSNLTTDQRGLPRVVGSAVDLGAFELQADEQTSEPPYVTNVSTSFADDTYTTGDSIDITVTFSEAVNVTGTPHLTLETGDVNAVATFSSVDGAILTFTYVVREGDTSVDLDYISTNALTLNGGSIKSDGLDALLTLPEPGTTGSLGANKSLVIDTRTPAAAPSVTIEQDSGQADPTNSSPIVFAVVFSQPVTGFTSEDVDLTTSTTSGTLSASISERAPNNGTTYSVTVSGMVGDGVVVAQIPAGRAINSSNVGNTASTSSDNSVTYDATAPDVSITSPTPDAVVGSAQPSITFSSADTSTTFECRVDAQDFAPCTSPFIPSTALSEGLHRVDIRAEDRAGNVTPASVNFTVDSLAPETNLDSGPAALTNDSTPTFSFSSPDNTATFECRLGTNDFAVCTSPLTLDSQLDGPYTFEVRAVDALDHRDTTPASASFTVDTTPPDVTLGSVPLLTKDSTPSFVFSSTDTSATFECRIDSAEFETCASPFTTSVLTDGEHSFHVRAVDAATNRTATPASTTFTVDTTAPDTTLDSTPSTLTNDATPDFAFSSQDAGVTFECRLDTDDFTICESPFTPTLLSDATHIFSVRAIDAAGNADETPASFEFTVDTITPTIEVTSSATSPTRISPIPVTITFSEPVTNFVVADLTIGNGSPGSLSSTDNQTFTVAITPTFDGEVSINVTANVAADAAGNGNSALESGFTITYDLTPPTTTISSPVNNALIPTKNPTFTFSANESNVTFTCTVNLNSVPCTSPHTHPGNLTEGPHSFTVKATDAAGNQEVSSPLINFTVDSFAPVTGITDRPAALIAANTATFRFNSSENTAKFECSLDSGDYAVCTSPHTILSLTEGPHIFAVRAFDAAGNRDASPSTATFTVDTLPPDVTISSPAAGTLRNNPMPSISFSSTDSGASFTCQLDNAVATPCSSPFTPGSALSEGPHSFSIVATDEAGNTSSTPALLSFTIDTTPPVTTISSPQANTTTSLLSKSVTPSLNSIVMGISVLLVGLVALLLMVTAGTTVSTVNAASAGVESALPMASSARTLNVCGPSTSTGVFFIATVQVSN